MRNLKTGTTIKSKDHPNWAVIDGNTGKVITFAGSRKWAREFCGYEVGERIARVDSVSLTVSK